MVILTQGWKVKVLTRCSCWRKGSMSYWNVLGDYSVVFGLSKSRRPKRNYVYSKPRSNPIFCLTHWNPLMDWHYVARAAK
ncbi:hypothetical protein D3C74_437160 [compost metagenome]